MQTLVPILILGRDAGRRRSIAEGLEGEGYRAVEASTEAGAVQAARRTRPSVVLVDIGFHDVASFGSLAGLRRLIPDTHVIALVKTAADAGRVLADGADEHVVTPSSVADLVARVTAATGGPGRTDRSALVFGELTIDRGRHLVTRRGAVVDLTRLEHELLVHLANRPGRTAARAELLEDVWGSTAAWQTTATVTEHVRRLRHKLEDDPASPRFILTVRGVGYRFEAPDATVPEPLAAYCQDGAAEAVGVVSGSELVFASPGLIALAGATGPGELVGRDVFEFIAIGSVDAVRTRAGRVESGHLPRPELVDLVTVDGRTVPVEMTSMPVAWRGRPARQVSMWPLGSRASGAIPAPVVAGLADALVEELSELVSVHDLDGTVRYVTPSVRALCGLGAETDMVGRQLLGWVHPDDRRLLQESFEAWVLGTGGPEGVRFRIGPVDDTWHELEAVGINLLDDETVGGVVVASRRCAGPPADSALAELVSRPPTVDPTPVTRFGDRLSAAMERAEQLGTAVAAVAVHVDRMRIINRSLGHAAGDEALAALGRLLESAVRPGDFVARAEGDVFLICCDDVASEAEVTAVVEDIQRMLLVPFGLADHQFTVTVSMGVALTPPGGGTSSARLLRSTTAAALRVKARGGDDVEIASGDSDQPATDRFARDSRLRWALDREEFEVHLQPEMDLATGAVMGFEALVRWLDPERGLLPPSEFIGLAEDNGLIIPLGRWVLEDACRQVVALDALVPPGDPRPWIAVNLSARQLLQPALVTDVALALALVGLDPDRLWLEITETAMMDDVGAAQATLEDLRALGIHLAIDDFGTGYSSLVYLRRFPVEMLKIDRSFVAGLIGDESDRRIVASVIGLAHSLGLRALAEGVETAEQLEALRALDCDYGQGYHWSRPLPPADLAPWLQRSISSPPAPYRGRPLLAQPRARRRRAPMGLAVRRASRRSGSSSTFR